MAEIDLGGTGPIIVPLAILTGGICMAGAVHLAERRRAGFLQYFPYAVLLSIAVLVFSSDRSLLSSYDVQGSTPDPTPLSRWTNHFITVFLLFVSLERIASYVLRRPRSGTAPYVLLLAFVTFWYTTVASPALFGATRSLSPEYLYTLLIGCAFLLLDRRESSSTVASARNGLVVFLAIGVALIPLRPTLVIDSSYAGGLLHGLPRLAGLAPHPVSLGMLAQLALLCLYAKPLSRRWLNVLCWIIGLLALFLAQSKASWLSFPVCIFCLYWFRDGSVVRDWRGGIRLNYSARIVLIGFLFAGVGLGGAYIFGNLGGDIDSHFTGEQANNVTSLSGRDKIWAVALEDWQRHPVFGYGPDLFDADYRTEIGMPFAFNGHDELVDTLGRSGLVGAVGLMLYAATLLLLSVKYARSSRGLSLALFLAIALRSVTEVPLVLVGYGPEVLQHFLLLAVLAGEARAGATKVTWPLRTRRPHSVTVTP